MKSKLINWLWFLLVFLLILFIGKGIRDYNKGKVKISSIDENSYIANLYYDHSNKLRARATYNQDSILNGEAFFYYENGIKSLENFYSNGKKEGLEKAFDKIGNLRYTGFYTEGMQDSIWQWYSDENEIITVENYFNGKPFGGQVNYNDGYLNEYKFYSLDGMLGKIDFDSLSRKAEIKGTLNYTTYNRRNLKLGESFTSMIYLGVPLKWDSNIKSTIVYEDDEKKESCNLKKDRTINTDKYYFDCKFKNQGNYNIRFVFEIFDDQKFLKYKDTVSLNIIIE